MEACKRHIVKAVSYRCLGTLQTCLISYFFTGSFWVSGSIGLVEVAVKPFMYFVHERVWLKIKFGTTKKQ